MSPKMNGIFEDLMDFGRKAAVKNLIWANSGNISHRLSESSFIISVSGAYLGELKEDDFVVLDLERNVMEGKKEPSIESKMHAAVYRVRPKVACVFHSQAFFTTLLSSTDLEVNPNLFPESMAYLKEICRVNYNHPGSHKLADEVSDAITKCDILILNNHGAICPGSSLSDVLLKTEALEMLCKMIIFSKLTDINLNFLPHDLKEDFLEHLRQIKDTK